MNSVFSKVSEFKNKYPRTIAWRLEKSSKVIHDHLNSGEEVLYAFAGQDSTSWWTFFFTKVIVLTNKRLILGQKRLLWGYFFTSVTPDLFNDLKVNSGLIWGKVKIDTVNELVVIKKLDKKALIEIETEVTSVMMKKKKKMKKGF